MTPGRTVLVMLLLLVSVTSGWAAPEQPPAWGSHLQAVDEALAAADVSTAVRRWHQGYGLALRSRTWVGLVDMGDAYLRIGRAGKFERSARPTARQAYLEALVRAQAQRSVEGALRVAVAFDDLGDVEVVDYCVRVAEALAWRAGDHTARQQVLRAREQFAQRLASRQNLRVSDRP